MNAVAHANEYLAFTLGDQEYGVDILKVQEIRGRDPIVRLPDTPDYILGVINLRGSVVPVVDLRIKFKLADVEYTATTVMIILTLAGQTVGIVVDTVSDVIELTPNQFRPTTQFDRTFNARQLIGMGVVDKRMLVLLNMEAVVLDQALENALATAPSEA